MPDKLLVDISGGIAVLTVNRPEVRNALDKETWGLLRDTVTALDNDDSVRVMVLTGAGDKAFIAGADVNALRVRGVLETSESENSAIARAIETLKKPIIAAINGFCLGGGNEVAMCCDIRIASDKARFGQTELNIGILPGAGGTQRLRNLVGKGLAMEMILTGDLISAQRALEIGLVNRVVPAESLMDEVMAVAGRIAAKSPLAVRLAKRVVACGEDLPIEGGLLLEVLSQAVMFSTQDHLEGIDAFLEKRDPHYTGK